MTKRYRFRRRVAGLLLATGVACVAERALAADAAAAPDLSTLSLEQLGEVQITSVSKHPEAIAEAPSSVYVISHDAIARSGAQTVPEILRLAPNLDVYQTSASRYVITARGFDGAPAAQNFANKLLVLIDGRTVYSPLFSGVYWDMQNVLPQDIDRIEVISGPGATLWGANAVNGVINIVTRSAGETQGGLVDLSGGSQQRDGSLRYGGRLGENTAWRIYARGTWRGDTRLPAGGDENDNWDRRQGGFRVDWRASSADTVTVQGDVYDGAEAQPGSPAEKIGGANLTARWSRTTASGGALQLQAYYDGADRGQENDGSGFHVDTYDIDLQHSFRLGERNEVVWGGGSRIARYRIHGASALQWAPASGDLRYANAFAQDSFSLSPDLKLIGGLKIEDDPYVRPTLLPNLRLSWTPAAHLSVWAAVSRAVRSPTPFDRDVVELSGGGPFLVGGKAFQSERLTAYEMGAKTQVASRASFSVTAFYNSYDELRNIELTPATFVPLFWGNGMAADTYGVEAWGEVRVRPGWRISGSVDALEERFRFKAGAHQVLGGSQAGDDPKYQATLKSSIDLGERVTVDTALRYVSALPEPRVPAYVELDGRLGWRLTERVQLALVGRNLLHDYHQEYVGGGAIPRSVSVDLQWQF